MDQKQIGILVLGAGIVGVVLAMMMDTSVGSLYGERVNNLGLMKDQQNYLMIAGVAVLAGLGLMLFGSAEGATTSPSSLRACPSCAEKIQPQAIKCRFCGTDVVPVQAASIGSVEGLSAADLQNLAEFYSIQQVDGGYDYAGQVYPSLADAVTAARSAS